MGRDSPLFIREHFAHFCMCMALYLQVISLVRYRVLHMQRQFKCLQHMHSGSLSLLHTNLTCAWPYFSEWHSHRDAFIYFKTVFVLLLLLLFLGGRGGGLPQRVYIWEEFWNVRLLMTLTELNDPEVNYVAERTLKSHHRWTDLFFPGQRCAGWAV